MQAELAGDDPDGHAQLRTHTKTEREKHQKDKQIHKGGGKEYKGTTQSTRLVLVIPNKT